MNIKLKNSKVYVWKGVFAIVKSKKYCPGAFANIKDKNEITVIVDQNRINEKDAIEINKNWKILTFDIVLPFKLVGFLAEIAKALADGKISVFAISAYSTDYILIKEKDLPRAIKKLESLGCVMRQE